jgi:hypothetical protein
MNQKEQGAEKRGQYWAMIDRGKEDHRRKRKLASRGGTARRKASNPEACRNPGTISQRKGRGK